MILKISISFIVALFFLQSCAQKSDKHNNLKLRSIYEVIKEESNPSLENYGLKGKIKQVIQKTHYAPKDTVINFNGYEIFDINEDRDYPFLAEMDNDCKVTFNEDGKVTNKVGFGRRFNSKSVETDTMFYDTNKNLKLIKNRLVGDDYTFLGDIHFEYNKAGHLVKKYVNKQIWLFSYFENKNQVKIVHHENNEFRSANVYTYNKFGQNIGSDSYKEDGTLDYRSEYKYDDLGEIEKEISYSANGDVKEYYKHIHEKGIKLYKQFDKNKNCTKRIIVDPKNGISIRTMEFEYYE